MALRLSPSFPSSPTGGPVSRPPPRNCEKRLQSGLFGERQILLGVTIGVPVFDQPATKRLRADTVCLSDFPNRFRSRDHLLTHSSLDECDVIRLAKGSPGFTGEAASPNWTQSPEPVKTFGEAKRKQHAYRRCSPLGLCSASHHVRSAEACSSDRHTNRSKSSAGAAAGVHGFPENGDQFHRLVRRREGMRLMFASTFYDLAQSSVHDVDEFEISPFFGAAAFYISVTRLTRLGNTRRRGWRYSNRSPGKTNGPDSA